MKCLGNATAGQDVPVDADYLSPVAVGSAAKGRHLFERRESINPKGFGVNSLRASTIM